MGKKRTGVTKEFYEQLVVAFRETPGNFSIASRRVGCNRRMAARGYQVGWVDRWPWARPIKIVLEEEIQAAQAQVRRSVIAAQEAAEADREMARQEAIEARKQEHQALKIARHDVLTALALAADLSIAMKGAVAAIKRDLAMKDDGSAPDIRAERAMSLIGRHALLIQRAVAAANAVIEISRLERGESTINVQNVAPDEHLSQDEIKAELAAIAEVLGEVHASRGLPAGALPDVEDALDLESTKH